MMTPPVPLEVGQRGLRHQEDAFDIHCKDPVPIALGKVDQRARLNDAGVVHEDVHLAEFRDRFVDEIQAGSAIRDINFERQRKLPPRSLIAFAAAANSVSAESP